MLSVEIGISILFFFSSRRRHTRLQGDWSSDVCSSDLEEFVRSDERLPADPRRGEIDQALVRHVDTLKGGFNEPTSRILASETLLPRTRTSPGRKSGVRRREASSPRTA